MKIKAVIWDVDGTLLNTQEGLTAAYRYTIEQCHLPSKTDEELSSYIGPTPQTIFMNHFGLNEENAQRAAEIFRERYRSHDLFKALLYPGVEDVLSSLDEAGIQQAIATNKRQDYATEICELFGLDDYCAPIIGADNENKLTKADIIKKCLEVLKISDPSSVVMIGDTEGDKQAAQAAGVQFLGVNYGFGFNNVLHYANSPEEILAKIEGGLNWKDRLITKLKNGVTQSWLDVLLGILAAVVIFLLQTRTHLIEEMKPLINEWLHFRYDNVWLNSIIFYILILFLYLIPRSINRTFLWAYIIAFIGILLIEYDNQNIISWFKVFLLALIPCCLLFEISTSKLWGTRSTWSMILLGLILSALWQIFVPDGSMTTLRIFYCDFINIICCKGKTIHDSLRVDILWNHVAFVGSLGVFIYIAFLCTTLKSRWRWILYITAGAVVFITGSAYYHDSDLVVQIAVFLFFLIIFCAGGALIKNEPEEEYKKPKEQLGLTLAYNKLCLLIRRFLEGEEQKAVLLMGRWGIGKTHCIRYLASELSREQYAENKQGVCNVFKGRVKICEVNLWEYSSREEAWNAIIQALGRTILGRYSFLNSITLNKYLPRVMRSLPAGNIFSSLYELVFLSDRDRDRELCKQLSDEIGRNNRIVLIFDDVERADFQIIKALPPLIEKLSRIERLMVICSLAKDELAKVHQREINQEKDKELALENLTGYLIKVFDYLFQIPDITINCCKKFIGLKLAEKIHGSECDLTKDFMENCGLLFTTPRQIDRSIELIMGIELQYKANFVEREEKKNLPEDAISNPLYREYSHTVFLVAIMKMLYPQVLHVAQLDPRGPVQFAKKVDEIFESLNSLDDANCSKVWQVEIFKKEYEYMYELVKTDYLVYHLLKALKDCSPDNVEKAIRGEYKRHLPLTSKETEAPYKKGSDNSSELIRRSPSGKSTIFQFIDPQKLERFENIMNHLSEPRRLDLFNQIVDQGCFERDRGIFQDDRITFLWSREHFFHLLYIYTRKFVGKKEIIDAVLNMFDQASAIEKVNILRAFCMDNLPFELKDTMSFTFNDYIEKISCSAIIDLIKEMYIRYIKNIIQDIVYFKVGNEEIVIHYYREYHFYDLLKREDFIKDCTIEVPEDTTGEGIVNLIDFVTLRSGFGGGYDGEQMATSEFKAKIILSSLNARLKTQIANSVASEKIDGWIEKSNDSIAYWKDDKTGLNALRDYTGGAEEVKKFLEESKGRQSSAKKG